MKKIGYIFGILLSVIAFSCTKEHVESEFKESLKLTIYDYLMENKEEYSSFIAILEKGGIDKTLSAYNPNSVDYTLFLPDNEAVNELIDQSTQFSSLNDLLNDQKYVSALSRYHVINSGIRTNEFPFGAFSDPTLSGNYLTVNFIIQSDTSYYKINNQAAVIKPNILTSNGYIHVVQNVITPVVYTSYEWIKQNPDYSIFKDAIDLTGIRPIIDNNLMEPGKEYLQPVTMLIESDEIFNEFGINSVEDLVEMISPGNNDYKNELNPLYNFVAYHILFNRIFIDDFVGESTNYNTYSEVPLSVNGLGLDIAINKGKQVFDTIVVGTDTTFIDYIGFLYNQSNLTTQSGVIHFIDRILEPKSASRATMRFEFREEPIINEIRSSTGSFSLEIYKEIISRIDWYGDKLYFVREGSGSKASNSDYLLINGDFSISYTIPKILQGRYQILLRADSNNSSNAFVEVFVDGKKIGSMIDLTTGGSSSNPFQSKEVGIVDFNRYVGHVIEIKSVIPGRFLWDYIQFSPI
jgi:uncharacterized surface protein with fasciclin (FAS1) repeats